MSRQRPSFEPVPNVAYGRPGRPRHCLPRLGVPPGPVRTRPRSPHRCRTRDGSPARQRRCRGGPNDGSRRSRARPRRRPSQTGDGVTLAGWNSATPAASISAVESPGRASAVKRALIAEAAASLARTAAPRSQALSIPGGHCGRRGQAGEDGRRVGRGEEDALGRRERGRHVGCLGLGVEHEPRRAGATRGKRRRKGLGVLRRDLVLGVPGGDDDDLAAGAARATPRGDQGPLRTGSRRPAAEDRSRPASRGSGMRDRRGREPARRYRPRSAGVRPCRSHRRPAGPGSRRRGSKACPTDRSGRSPPYVSESATNAPVSPPISVRSVPSFDRRRRVGVDADAELAFAERCVDQARDPAALEDVLVEQDVLEAEDQATHSCRSVR